jgi:hypothetical protein
MPKTHTRIIRSLLFSLLLGLFPILALWRYNLGQLSTPALYQPLGITAAFILVTFTLGLLVSRSWEKAGLISVLTSLFALSFGHLYNLVGVRVIFGITIGYFKLLAVCFIVYALLFFLILRAKRVNGSIFLIGNLVGAFLLLLNLVPVIQHDIAYNQAIARASTESNPTAAAADESQPDIYYILLDSYAREDILKEVIGYDNSAFIAGLKERGFYIPDCAFSNYEVTLKTLTSVLNLDYLNNLNIEVSNTDDDATSNDNLVIDNKIREIMRGYGYQFVTGRGHSSVVDINNSDLYFNYFQNQAGSDDLDKQRFSSLYFNTTVLRVFSEIFQANPEKAAWLPYWLAVDRESSSYLAEASHWYYQNNYMFDSLETIPGRQGDYFVYAHIIAPHTPYVYRADGTFNYPLDSTDEKVLYAEEVQYLNQRVLEVIDTLLSESDVPPVIILQADHSINEMTTGLDKHKILSAYYLPGELTTPPYATITPVNDFRLIIKNYFDPSMELLPDYLYVRDSMNAVKTHASCDLDSK